MISPTGKGIRVDSEGDGNYGSRRAGKRHNGIDYLCNKGADIVAPFRMFLERVSYPKRNSSLSGIAWKTGKSSGRMWYFSPKLSLLNTWVKQGEIIGQAQSVSYDYNLPNMKDHVHFQINK